MNQWKKGILAAILLMVLTGCGAARGKVDEITANDAAEYATQALGLLQEMDSFAAEFHAKIEIEEAGDSITEGTVSLIKKPLFMKVDMNMSFDGLEQEYDMYLEKTEDGVNQYMSYDGEWTEMTLTEDAALSGAQIYHTLNNMEIIFSEAAEWEAEKADSKIVMTAVIPEEKFYAVEEYTRWFQLAGMSGLSEKYYEGIGDVPVTILLDGKTGVPVSYEVELAQPLETMTNHVLTELGGGVLEEAVEVEEYTIFSAFTQLGGVETEEIPPEAKSDAINYEKEISLLEMAAE